MNTITTMQRESS